MSNEEIIANSVVFFLAGYETVATSATIATFLVATHPQVQEKLAREIDTQLEKLTRSEPEYESGSKSRSEGLITDPLQRVTLEALSRFEYLNAVVSETLRLYTPTPFIERTASRDVKLETSDGKVRVSVKRGDIVHIPLYSVHHDEAIFERPDEFLPERFLDESRVSSYKNSYLPFGAGPRGEKA